MINEPELKEFLTKLVQWTSHNSPAYEALLQEKLQECFKDDNEYPHDARCEGVMCYCAARAKREDPEKWAASLKEFVALNCKHRNKYQKLCHKVQIICADCGEIVDEVKQ